jgi:chlorite dismutase
MFTTFRGGQSGIWQVTLNSAVKGESLPAVPALSITQSAAIALPLLSSAASWRLAGVTSHAHYVEKSEKEQLAEKQAPLGRKEATFAALIPIRKSAAWWELSQNERREIFEAKSHHIEGTLKYLPQVARQIFHSRDLGEPFDFITWFEYASEHAPQFEELVSMLRDTEEWTFVDREVDVRLMRED